MDIIDSNIIHENSIHSDICIIGAGPAGISLAAMLADSSLDVIVAESGGKKSDAKTDELNTLHIESNFRYRNGESERNRQIGGTANLWAGRVVPFTFNPVLDEEWGDLKNKIPPFYKDAFRLFGIHPEIRNEHRDSDSELVAYWAHQTERFNTGSKILTRNKRCRICQFLTCIGEPEFEGDRISRLTFVNRNQERIYIRSRCFVFAMGSIENARMLLVIDKQMENRATRNFENVGKYIMDHPRIWQGSVACEAGSSEISRYQIRATEYGLYKTGIRKQPGATRVYCNLMKTVNRVNFLLERIPVKSFQVSSKKLLLREKGVLRTIANESARFPLIRRSAFIKNFLREFFNDDYSQNYHIMTYCEQRPREENQIVLGRETDRNNLRIPKLKNALHKDELNEVITFYKMLNDITSAMDCLLDYDEEYLSNPVNYTDASHIMGGTRYSPDKSRAVLEDDLSVIGIPNLYITGSSVFPTGGVENPTHLIVSLSCYLANVLEKQYRQV